jgi:hypothetical protein
MANTVKPAKTFTEQFLEARLVSTPQIVIRTHDPFATTKAIAKSFTKSEEIPFVSWDAIRGLVGLTEGGSIAVANMLKPSETSPAETVNLAVALGVLAAAEKDVIVFVHNPHLVWNEDKKVLQGIMNLRDDYKANGNLIALLIGVGDELPSEIGQDVLVLNVPLPNRDRLAEIVKLNYEYAAQEAAYKACAKGPDAETIRRATDAGIGLPEFPFDQEVAVCLDKKTGILDIDALWTRKREIVTQNPGLTYHPSTETLKDMAGCESWIEDARVLAKKATIIIRMDEIQRQFSGSDTDSSGTKGNLMGAFLNWINDRKVICTLNLGVSGTSKSWGAYCIAGEYGKPVVECSIPDMEDKHVGDSSKNFRNAINCLDAIGDGNIWLIGTANKLDGLPPEFISRFQMGGIYFFDIPSEPEKAAITKIKMNAYGLNTQPLPAMVGWTGRDIDNCARRAQVYGRTMVEAAKRIVPLHESHHDEIEAIRMAASGRFLSASSAGVYTYTPSPVRHEPTAKIVEGRKFRTE